MTPNLDKDATVNSAAQQKISSSDEEKKCTLSKAKPSRPSATSESGAGKSKQLKQLQKAQ